MAPYLPKVSTPRPLYIQTTNEKIVHSAPCALNYVPALARYRAKYQADKAKWEANNPNEPYPHQPPQPDGRRSAAARKFPYPTH